MEGSKEFPQKSLRSAESLLVPKKPRHLPSRMKDVSGTVVTINSFHSVGRGKFPPLLLLVFITGLIIKLTQNRLGEKGAHFNPGA